MRCEYVEGRHLGARIDCLQVAGEAAHHAQPLGPHDRLDALWELGEADGQLGGDARRLGGVEVVHELRKQRAMQGQLEPERSA